MMAPNPDGKPRVAGTRITGRHGSPECGPLLSRGSGWRLHAGEPLPCGLRLRQVRLRLDQRSNSLLNLGSKEAAVAADLETREHAAPRIILDRRQPQAKYVRDFFHGHQFVK